MCPDGPAVPAPAGLMGRDACPRHARIGWRCHRSGPGERSCGDCCSRVLVGRARSLGSAHPVGRGLGGTSAPSGPTGTPPGEAATPLRGAPGTFATMVPRDAATGTAVLVLPDGGRGPGPSVEVQRTRAGTTACTVGEARLWEVPTVSLLPPDALEYLLSADHQTNGTSRFRVAA